MTELMKRYEAERGGIMPCGMEIPGGFIYSKEYVAWLEAKAAAYDRLMSGGKKTLKEWANIFGMPFAIDGGRYGYNCDDVGSKEPLIWIPPRFIDYDGNYGESRTLPDGWEEI